MTTELVAMDEFDGLLNDVLRTVANPELPERIRLQVRTRVWVREVVLPSVQRHVARPAVVFAPEVFLAQMAPQRDRRTTGAAVLLHVAAIGLLVWAVSLHRSMQAPTGQQILTELTTPPTLPAKSVMGGGGGQRGATPVTQGHLPKFTDKQIVPPKAPPMQQPKIRMPDAAVEAQTNLKMADNTMPNIGMPNSRVLGTGSMGNGTGSGLGSGSGGGIGLGTGGNFGGGLKMIGGGVSSPVLVHKIEPEFSEEARKSKFMGNVVVSLVVDPQGIPRNVHLVRGVGMGLDEKALEAVRQYRFRPAMEAGKPVAVEMHVEVDFQIF
jgi:protein TonB